MSAQRLAQTLSADRRFSRLPLKPAPRSVRLSQVSVRIWRAWWWSARWCVATLHGLPPPRL